MIKLRPINQRCIILFYATLSHPIFSFSTLEHCAFVWHFPECKLSPYHPLLHCTALRCSVVSCTALRYTALSYSALHLSSLHFTALYCTALHSTALHCTALHFPSPHCTTPHYTTLYLLGVFVRQSQTLHRNNPSPPQRSGSNTLN